MASSGDCFHCGEPLPPAPSILARFGDEQRPVCCLGCKAVAEFIQDNDLGAFYAYRDKPRAGMDVRPLNAHFRRFDDADMLARYVDRDEERAETALDIGGMYCTACVWLLDRALSQHAAIRSVDVNAATRRAIISWDLAAMPFSRLLQAIAEVGFKPEPVRVGYASDSSDKDYRQSLRRLIVAAAAGMQVMMFAVALYAGDHFGIDGAIEQFLRTISLLVTLPIVFYSARPFFYAAWRGLLARTPGMDLPVSLAIGFAFAASTWAVWTNSGEVYFDSVAMFVLFLSATRFLEMRARHRADDQALSLARLLPDTAARLTADGEETVSVDRLRAGDLLRIRPGDIVPADGEIASGELAVDESLMTGESMPVTRGMGMQVFAGGMTVSGSATLRVLHTGASTSIAGIGRLLERAKADRPPITVLADRIAGHFVVSVLVLATLAGGVWLVIDPSRAFGIVLATLVVTCPCALALATPAALAAAASRLATSGFYVIRSRILDVLRRGATFIFDKTGTLTRGEPTIVDTRLLPSNDGVSESYCRELAAALESASEHVLARAFTVPGTDRVFAFSELVPQAGAGVEATMEGTRYRIGSRDYVSGIAGECELPKSGGDATLVYLGCERGFLAEFTIGDELRGDAHQALSQLQDAGFGVVIASGDRTPVVAAAARALGVTDWHAELTPEDKLALVARRQRSGERVIMVGDGINDAPVMQAADASIAMDAGTALARASADAVALSRRLLTVVDAVQIAAQTRRIIHQNIAWAIGYNLTAVPLAVSGMLAPWMAALGMSMSSLLVVLNALRLHRYRNARTPRRQGTAASQVAERALT
ncbi:MAG: heavy metal translocating P-type ATPase [Woeseia sp.]